MKELLRHVLFSCFLLLSFCALAADKVDINSADKKTLMSIKGIGEARAKAIIDYRKQHGDFKTLDDLAKIKGIGERFVKKNRKNLTTKSTGKGKKK